MVNLLSDIIYIYIYTYYVTTVRNAFHSFFSLIFTNFSNSKITKRCNIKHKLIGIWLHSKSIHHVLFLFIHFFICAKCQLHFSSSVFTLDLAYQQLLSLTAQPLSVFIRLSFGRCAFSLLHLFSLQPCSAPSFSRIETQTLQLFPFWYRFWIIIPAAVLIEMHSWLVACAYSLQTFGACDVIFRIFCSFCSICRSYFFAFFCFFFSTCNNYRFYLTYLIDNEFCLSYLFIFLDFKKIFWRLFSLLMEKYTGISRNN